MDARSVLFAVLNQSEFSIIDPRAQAQFCLQFLNQLESSIVDQRTNQSEYKNETF